MRDYERECAERVAWIKDTLEESGAKGVIFGLSGGKDSALVGILCRKATERTLGVTLPCGQWQQSGSDMEHAGILAGQYSIQTANLDLTQTRETLLSGLNQCAAITGLAKDNINPRLRMTALYALGQAMGYLVAGTGNKSEIYMGYFTKWGDGACDFNPIADLYAHEVVEFLTYLNAPPQITKKAPSAGLFEGQTDEADMGVSYDAIDAFIETGRGNEADAALIRRAHAATAHKRRLPKTYGG